MSDNYNNYDTLKVFRSFRCDAQRAAVLGSVLGPDWLRRGHTQAFKQLQRIWQVRLAVLRAEGWDVLRDDLAFDKARNCPPFGIKRLFKRWQCKRPIACPFCWARRYVMAPLRHLEARAWGQKGDRVRPRPTPGRSVLIGYETVMDWPPDPILSPAQARGEDLFSARMVTTCAHLRRGAPGLVRGHRGGFVLHKVETLPQGVRLTRSGILLADRGPDWARILGDLDDRPEVRVLPLDRRNLGELVAWTCRYPASALLGEPGPFLDLLATFRGAHLLSCLKPSSAPLESGFGAQHEHARR